MRKIILLLLIALLANVGALAEAKTFLPIATGGVAGVYYPIGRGLAQIINDYVPDVEAMAETGNASVANIGRIANREVSLALVQNDAAFWAAKGMKPFKVPVPRLRVVASLYPEHVHCIAVKGSGIRTFADLRGKRVSVGAPGSGVAASLGAIFPLAGLKYSAMDPDFLDFADTVEGFQEGELDVGFVLAGYPAAAVAALAAQKEIELVPFEEELLDGLVRRYPYFSRGVIPAGTYKGTDRDTPAPTLRALLVCDSSLPDDLVYAIVKALFEHLDALQPFHEKAKLISLESALEGASIEVHPGAAKYYAEKGLKLPKF